jgi:hypothetical protein
MGGVFTAKLAGLRDARAFDTPTVSLRRYDLELAEDELGTALRKIARRAKRNPQRDGWLI